VTFQATSYPTDSSGNYTSTVGVFSGADAALETLEPSFQQDLNGDQVIGLNIPIVVIEHNGSTSLTQVGNNYFFYANGTTTGPALKYAGAAVVAGQFGAWAPIGAEQTASGYEVAWKVTGADRYAV
jgi:serralysin